MSAHPTPYRRDIAFTVALARSLAELSMLVSASIADPQASMVDTLFAVERIADACLAQLRCDTTLALTILKDAHHD